MDTSVLQDEVDAEVWLLFNALDREMRGTITLQQLLKRLNEMGIMRDDPCFEGPLNAYVGRNEELDESRLSCSDFARLLQGGSANLIKNAIRGEMVIPDFKQFGQDIKDIYQAVKKNDGGDVASYIPQLARVNPDLFAISVCTIDGQKLQLGAHRQYYCVQWVCKPLNYCIILEEHGEERVHKHVGREPSGIGFNGLVLNDKGLPHNPMINAGAIMVCSLLKPHMQMADRFDAVLDIWTRLSGNLPARFD